MFRGLLPDLSPHAYAAAAVLLGEDAKLEIAGHGQAKVWLVAAGTTHTAKVFGGRCSVLLFDVDTSIARTLVSHLPAQRPLAVPDARAGECFDALLDFQQNPDFPTLQGVLHDTIEPAAGTLDPRVAEVCARLRETAQPWPSVGRLAAGVGLSEPRLQHLFKAQTCIRLGQFKTALQMRGVARVMAAGSTLTAAAHTAGFADSAHFSRRFREMFGLKPSVIFRQLGATAIHTDP